MTTFQITVQPSGRTFTAPADEAILAAAIRGNVGLPYSCKDGACGSCKCKKISGQIEHDGLHPKALSPEEAQAGYVLTCCARPLSDIVLESRQVTQASAHPIKKLPVRVAALTRLTHDVMHVQLQLPATSPLQWHAGQYIEFILPDGTRRAYSMANAPQPHTGAPIMELHIRHMPGGRFTDHVFSTLKERDILRIEGPFGSFFLRENTQQPVILLASGTGFAPVKALMEHMQHQGITRQTTLYWGVRRPHDLYMDGWMRERMAEMPQLHYVPVVSDALPEDGWQGRTGWVHAAVLEDFADLSGHQVYACGTPAMVQAARNSYSSQRGLPEEAFFADAFTSEADKH